MPDVALAGGCQCGAVRYTIIGTPLQLYVCHCRECQKQSASAFGMSLIVARAALALTQGEPRVWSRTADSGRRIAGFLCAECGSRLWHEREGFDSVSVKAGSLDAGVDFSRTIHIWTSRRMPGVLIPQDALQFAEEPE